MWWGIGVGLGILYFFPILWIFGAFMSPAEERVAQVQ